MLFLEMMSLNNNDIHRDLQLCIETELDNNRDIETIKIIISCHYCMHFQRVINIVFKPFLLGEPKRSLKIWAYKHSKNYY